ncbi:unnamed protein product [Brassicogethes aeneus]|uniref:CCHC-type domain-containing protein n=1 Tax=Brassicogethes aeneus TaxID=1431903 RepID=A0A9P0BCS0_BRAAE|nr:unnamed protein product [Brassicogethes aeneus]
MGTCSKCSKSFKELYVCEDCKSAHCTTCSELTATEQRVMELKKKTLIFRCGDCSFTTIDLNLCKVQIEHLKKEILLLKDQILDKTTIINDKMKIITLQEEKLVNKQQEHNNQKTITKKKEKSSSQSHQDPLINENREIQPNAEKLYSTATKSSYKDIIDAQKTKMNELININKDTHKEKKLAQKTSELKKISYGSNKSGNKFQGTPKKVWLFISRVNKDVVKEDITQFLNDKDNLKEREFIIEEVEVNRKTTKCFKIGADYDLLEEIYKPDFWPSGIGYSRYYFSREDQNKVHAVPPPTRLLVPQGYTCEIRNTQTQYDVNQSSSKKSYSTVLNEQQFPNKHQAIVFSSIDGIKIHEYILALGEKVGPKRILFSSRISNNRICIYLSSKEIADKFINEHGSIIINNEIIQARKLVTPSQRIVLSNVSPTIPHTALATELGKMGLTLMSPITFLRIGIPNPEYSHILSFRRQVYIAPQNCSIPDSIVITDENTPYRIFITQDGLTCFKCKQQNHLAANCPNSAPENIEEVTHATVPENPINILSQNNTINQTPNINENSIIESPTGSKRSISTVLTPPLEDNPKSQTEPFIKPKETAQKKLKTRQHSDISTKTVEQLMEPVKKFVEENKFALNFEQITDFFENVHGSPDPLSCAKQYTSDIHDLIVMLTLIYPHFTERSIKTRCTKIRNKLSEQIKVKDIVFNRDRFDLPYKISGSIPDAARAGCKMLDIVRDGLFPPLIRALDAALIRKINQIGKMLSDAKSIT